VRDCGGADAAQVLGQPNARVVNLAFASGAFLGFMAVDFNSSYQRQDMPVGKAVGALPTHHPSRQQARLQAVRWPDPSERELRLTR